MNLKYTLFGLLLSLLTHFVHAQSVDFVEPKDSSTVSSPFKVSFAVTGMEVAPAGEIKPNSGHHHLIINAGSVPEGETIPFDDTHKHFGKGQTETEVSLPPGKYSLTMQFANGAHQSYGPKLSKTISVIVK
jgi:Domain of unknown function (DUF4399)